MKLSSIINKDGFLNATINIHAHYVVVELFVEGRRSSKLSVHKSLNIDIDLKEANVENVKQLGVKRYRNWESGKKYLNVYNY